jgi:hypothetical protein
MDTQWVAVPNCPGTAGVVPAYRLPALAGARRSYSVRAKEHLYQFMIQSFAARPNIPIFVIKI